MPTRWALRRRLQRELGVYAKGERAVEDVHYNLTMGYVQLQQLHDKTLGSC
jgi:hypothetical protein